MPVICVGNLSFGGTGKTPMVEYLVRLLEPTFDVAIVSRGYGRKTKGFILANSASTVEEIGDEPFQYKSKFPGIRVAVDVSRANAIDRLKPVELVLLDDAFQHRSVAAGINILLTAYRKIYSRDKLFPVGRLRDLKSRAKKADIIVITKCPKDLTKQEQHKQIQNLNPKANQRIYFATIEYGDTLHGDTSEISVTDLKNRTFTLVTGIADPMPLVRFLESRVGMFEHLRFSDHHRFSKQELLNLSKKERIVTTEKDFTRLRGKLKNPLYYIPIKMAFPTDGDDFDERILRFAKGLK